MWASNDSSLPAPSQIALSAEAWNIQYSPGMPAHPTAVEEGWYFDFPAPSCGWADVCSVHYVTTPVQMSVTTRRSRQCGTPDKYEWRADIPLSAEAGQHLRLSRACKILSAAK